MEIKQPTIEMVPVERLQEWAQNPRRKHAVSAIGKSIAKFGYLSPITVQKDTYRVLAGHGRLKALRARKVNLIPVIIADITDAEADAYTVADNKLNDISDFDLSGLGSVFKTMDKDLLALTGFSDDEVKSLEAQLAPAPPEPAEGGPANTTLFITFGTRQQYLAVKAEIKRLQAGTEKTIGEIMYETFFPGQP